MECKYVIETVKKNQKRKVIHIIVWDAHMHVLIIHTFNLMHVY